MDRYGDFQCDRTEGYPTLLCVDYEKQEYWIELNDLFNSNETDVSYYQALCDKFGKRHFGDVEHLLNQIKIHFGEEAYENCAYTIMREFNVMGE